MDSGSKSFDEILPAPGDYVQITRGFGDPRPSFCCLLLEVFSSPPLTRTSSFRAILVKCLYRTEVHELMLYEELGDTWAVISKGSE